jgi:hypothetical protein
MRLLFKGILCLMVANMFALATFAQTLVAGEYFFNSDPGPGKATPLSFPATASLAKEFSIPVNSLPVGFHHLFTRLQDNAGQWSIAEQRSFYVDKVAIENKPKIKAAEYFFDTDPGIGKGISIPVSNADSLSVLVNVNAGALPVGFHQLFIRLQDDVGQWSIAEQRSFYVDKVAIANKPKIKAAEYFFDTDPGTGKGISIPVSNADSLTVLVNVNAGALPVGFHQLFIRLQDEAGQWSIAEQRSFFIDGQAGNDPVADTIVAGEYFIAPDPGPGKGIPFSVRQGVSVDTLFNYIADSLPYGEYFIGIRLKNASGAWGFSESRKFRTCETYGPIAKFELVQDGNKVSLLNRSEYATVNKWVINSGDSVITTNFYGEYTAGNYRAFLAASNNCGRDTVSRMFAIEGLKGIFPNKGGDIGKATVHIEGFGFVPGTTFTLTRNGFTLPADEAIVLNGDKILAGLYLGNVPQGFYRLEVQIPGKQLLAIDSAFEVVAGIQPVVTIATQIPPIVRLGRPTLLRIFATNQGNIDAYGVPIIISGLPISGTARLLNDTAPPIPGVEYDDDPRANLSRFELIDSIQGTRMIPLVIPRLGPSQTYEILLEFTGFQNGAYFNYFVKSLEPLYRNEVANDKGSNSNGIPTILAGDCGGDGGVGGIGGPGNCANCLPGTISDALTKVGETLLDLLPLGSIFDCFSGTVDIISGVYKLQTEEQGCPKNNNPLESLNTVMSYNDLIVGIAKTGADCAAAVLKANPAVLAANTAYKAIKLISEASEVYDAFKTGYELGDCLAANPPCRQPACPDCGVGGRTGILASWDPNEKKGPGYADSSFIRTTSDLTYTVYYENADTATLPAQTVIVTDTLDISKFDPATLQFTFASVGTRTTPLTTKGYNAIGEIDLRPQVPFIARINAILDTATGIIQWQVQTIDPQTGQETTDPLAGFLPPNNETHWGEGSFTFTVQLRPSVQQGDTIRNKASIVFDVNEPIITNYWVNMFDTGRPTSKVNALPAIVNKDSIEVSWSGTDAVSGIDFYNVWVSVNDGPFVIWLAGTTALKDTFVGFYGNSYRFYSLAQDRAGNTEWSKSMEETKTTMVLIPTVFRFVGNGSYKDAANWKDGIRPPAVLPSGSEIIIDPAGDGECIMDKLQDVKPGGKFTIAPGKKIKLLTDLELTQPTQQ